MDYIKIKFPTLNLTIKNWNSEDINEVLLFDEYFYNKSNNIFDKYCKNHIIVDSDGNTYKVIGVEKLKFWQNLFPFFIKRKMYFEERKEKKSLNELREYILEKIYSLPDNSYKKEWIQNLKNAQSYKSLILGLEL